MSFITDFKEKKLVEYLENGQKVLIRFGHGLGDTLLFYPIFLKLKGLYPDVQIDLYVESGQEEVFPSIKDKDATGYDHVFSLDFPMSEGSSQTKPEKCCVDEIGIEPITDVAALPRYKNPFVAVHFQGTALPGSVSCPQETAEQIYKEIKDAGFIPIECHFEHCWHNPINQKFPFIDNSVRGYPAKVSTLIAMLRSSAAFIGIASGPFVTAMSVIPEKTLYLEKSHKLENYTTKDIATVQVDSYVPGSVKTFLQNLGRVSADTENKIEWAVDHYRNNLKEKAAGKILWGNRSIWKPDWIVIKQYLKEHPEIKTVLEYGTGLSTELMQLEGLEITCLESMGWWADICHPVIKNKETIKYEAGSPPPMTGQYDMIFMDGPQSGERLAEVVHAKSLSKLIYYHDLDAIRLPTIIDQMKDEWTQLPAPYNHFFQKNN